MYKIFRTQGNITVIDPIGIHYVFESRLDSVFIQAAKIFDEASEGKLTLDEAGKALVDIYPAVSPVVRSIINKATVANVNPEVVKERIEVFEKHEVVVDTEQQAITFRGELVDDKSSLYALMLSAILNDSDDTDRLNKFLEKLLRNKFDLQQITQVCNFMLGKQLETGRYNITADGDLELYRSARCHGNIVLDANSSSIPQIVGATYVMDKKFVDKDPTRTCSYGLHVATRNYAEGFAKVLFLVAVNPADIVSVPTDYGFEKVRCTKYKILKLVKGYEEHEAKVTLAALCDFAKQKFEEIPLINVGQHSLDGYNLPLSDDSSEGEEDE